MTGCTYPVTCYVAALPDGAREDVRRRVTAALHRLGEGTYENIEAAMSSRLCDLDGLIDIKRRRGV